MEEIKHMDRRSFLKFAGMAGVAGALPLVSPAIGLASIGGNLKVAQETRLMMGTLVGVTVVDNSVDRAQKGMDLAFKAMQDMSPTFDRFSPGGAVAELNKTGELKSIPPTLAKVLGLCKNVRMSSGGAFDISVAPVVDTFKTAYKVNKSLPTKKQLLQATAAIGGFEYDGNTAKLTKEGAAITLDGVAKGFIVDAGMEALKKAGITRGLINAGGDVAVLGNRKDGRPWKVGVADPKDKKKTKMVISMTAGAIATSGNYEIYFDQEKLFHHIINPATGMSPKTDLSASVKAPNAAVADALSTACFVMEPAKAMQYLQGYPGIQGMVLTRHGQRYQSKGFGT
jgi:thiamine biosynthesis lipoprotein